MLAFYASVFDILFLEIGLFINLTRMHVSRAYPTGLVALEVHG